MPSKESLLQRLDEIGVSLEKKGNALALLGLGSVGIETDLINHLGKMVQGYDKVPESAIHILNYMEGFFSVNKKLNAEIRRLASQCRL